MKKHSNFIKDVIYVIMAQMISFIASFFISLIIPKFIEVNNYAYWQLFLFYITYINITRLGLIDGLYLRLGGKKYKDLDYDTLGKEWFIFFIYQVLISSIIFIFILFSNINVDRKFVFGACCLCMIIINSNNYFSYILQAVNQTRKYSISIIIENAFWFIATLIIIVFKIYSYKIIVIMYVSGHIASGIYLSSYCKKILKLKLGVFNNAITDIKKNIKCGIFLMASTYAGNLIIGSVRMIIDGVWGIKTFGYFSFSLTLANFILTIIKQVSIVLFPAIRRIPLKSQKQTYLFIKNILEIFLPFIMLCYLPLCIIVKLWLPQYIPSLKYLVFFLPICIFEGRMQLLYITYFKVWRKEKNLLLINFIAMIFSIILSLFGAYIFKNIYFISIGLLMIIIIRSIISEFLLSSNFKNDIKNIIFNLLLIILFIIVSINLKLVLSFLIYLFCYILYLVYNKSTIKQVYLCISNKKIML